MLLLGIHFSNQVYDEKSVHEIWKKQKELHDGTSDVTQQKYDLVRHKFEKSKMLPNELENDIYSRLNVTVDELTALGLNKLSDEDISRKIVDVLPKEKYATIVTCLYMNGNFKNSKPSMILGRSVHMSYPTRLQKNLLPQINQLHAKKQLIH